MIRARLIVLSPYKKDEGGNPVEDNWGELDFDSLPSSGDRISVVRDYDLAMVTVKFAVHMPVPYPKQASETPSFDRKAPAQHIIAEGPHW